MAGFAERMKQANLTFGGRILCPFPRPNFVSPAVYEQIRGVCRGIFRAIEKVERRTGHQHSGTGSISNRKSASSWPSTQGSSAAPPPRASTPSSPPSKYQFVELNAETPAGIGYAEILADVFLEMPARQEVPGALALRRFRSRERAARDPGGLLSRRRRPRPRSPRSRSWTTTRSRPAPSTTCTASSSRRTATTAVVCDPRHLTYEGGRLRHERHGRSTSSTSGCSSTSCSTASTSFNRWCRRSKDRAVTLVNPFKCKPLHKKAIFAVLTDDELQRLFTEEEQAAIRAHVPWTRRVSEGTTTRDGQDGRPSRAHPQGTGTAGDEAERRVRRQGRLHRLGDVGHRVGSGPGHGPSGFVRGPGEGRALQRRSFPELGPAGAGLPRPRGGPRPLPVRRRGGGLPHPPLRDVARQRHLGRRTGARPSSWSPRHERALGSSPGRRPRPRGRSAPSSSWPSASTASWASGSSSPPRASRGWPRAGRDPRLRPHRRSPSCPWPWPSPLSGASSTRTAAPWSSPAPPSATSRRSSWAGSPT